MVAINMGQREYNFFYIFCGFKVGRRVIFSNTYLFYLVISMHQPPYCNYHQSRCSSSTCSRTCQVLHYDIRTLEETVKLPYNTLASGCLVYVALSLIYIIDECIQIFTSDDGTKYAPI